MRRMATAMLLMALAAAVAVAQESQDAWESLMQLRSGQKIYVVDKNLKKVKGQFLGASDNALSFRVNGRDFALGRSDVVLVSRPPAKRRNVLLGMLIGGLMGASAWAEVDRAARNCDPYGYFCEKEHGLPGYSFPIFVGAATGTGALIGSLLKSSEQVLYVHDPRKTEESGPPEPKLEPGDAGKPEGGNVFAPLSTKEAEKPAEEKPAEPH